MISNLIDGFLNSKKTISSNICLFNLQTNNNSLPSSLSSTSDNKSKEEITIENDENYFETIQHLNFIFNNVEFINQYIEFYKSKNSKSIIFLMDTHLYIKFKSFIHQLLDHHQLSPETKVVFLLNKNENEFTVDPSKAVVNGLELYKLQIQWFIYSSSNSDDLKTQGLYWLTQNL